MNFQGSNHTTSSLIATINQSPITNTHTGPSSFPPHTDKSHCYLARATDQTFHPCPAYSTLTLGTFLLESPRPSPTSVIINLPLADREWCSRKKEEVWLLYSTDLDTVVLLLHLTPIPIMLIYANSFPLLLSLLIQ